MSELLASVKGSFFHDVLIVSDAEARLEGREGAYLLQENDVKPSMFILSFVKSSAVSHILIPNKNGKYFRQTLEDAVVKTADIIAAPDIYTSSVPPPGSPQDSSGSETHDFDSTSFTLQATTNERWRAIRKVTRLSNVKSAASISSQA